VEEPLARQGGNVNRDGRKVLPSGARHLWRKQKQNSVSRQLADGVYEWRERDVFYNAIFAGENSALSPENAYFWNLSV
jgi:hypothetical protein